MKTTKLIICILLLLSVVSGCSSKSGKNLYSSDTVIVTISGEKVTWEEYYNWLCYGKNVFEENTGEITDWTAEYSSGVTYSDYMKGAVTALIKYYKAIEIHAKELGIGLTLEDETGIADAKETAISSYGSEEAFNEYLTENYGSPELYNYLTELSCISNNCGAQQFGANGEKLAKQDILDYVSGDEYMMVKHILIKFDDDDDGTDAANEKISGILTMLEEYDGDDIEGYFTQLMTEYSEDSGLESYPDGYLFKTGDMTEEFETAASALDEYEYSDIVETSNGYHIIIRLPINVDAVPVSSDSSTYTLRQLVASEMFYSVLDGWRENIEIQTSEAFDTLDLAKAFTD